MPVFSSCREFPYLEASENNSSAIKIPQCFNARRFAPILEGRAVGRTQPIHGGLLRTYSLGSNHRRVTK